MRRFLRILTVLAALGVVGCGAPVGVGGDAGGDEPALDAGGVDAGAGADAGSAGGGAGEDAGTGGGAGEDAGTGGGAGDDAGTGGGAGDDAGTGGGAGDDAGTGGGAGDDAGTGGGAGDDAGAGEDAGTGGDAGSLDAGPTSDAGATSDAGVTDAGAPVDAGSPYPGGCVSGATGHYAARFHWAGNGSGSTAYVQYDVNNLPDHSRWHAGAYSRGSIGYTPVFSDVYLGAGGLELGSSQFMDVELSTSGLTTIRHVWLALKGRSYNTTASGSFTWMTFDGAGASPQGFVANSAPYEWYVADATGAFVPGNGSVLLRIEAGPPSSSLVVNAVELCVDGE